MMMFFYIQIKFDFFFFFVEEDVLLDYVFKSCKLLMK